MDEQRALLREIDKLERIAFALAKRGCVFMAADYSERIIALRKRVEEKAKTLCPKCAGFGDAGYVDKPVRCDACNGTGRAI